MRSVPWDLQPDHCRAARYLLGWRVRDLAQKCGLSEVTVGRFESGEGNPQPRTVRDILRALQDAGVEVIATDGGTREKVHCKDGTVLAVRK